MSKPGKTKIGFIKLQLPAGSATPSPPVGPALGQKGLNLMEFCKAFNDATKNFEKGLIVRVGINAYSDRTFDFEIYGVSMTQLIRREIGLEKGSTAPGRIVAGSISWDQIKKIAQEKMKYGLSARTVPQAMKIVAGTVRSFGLKITGEMPQITEGAENG